MQKAITVTVMPISGGFNVSELNEYLSQGYTVNNAYASTDNALLVILDEPKKETSQDQDLDLDPPTPPTPWGCGE